MPEDVIVVKALAYWLILMACSWFIARMLWVGSNMGWKYWCNETWSGIIYSIIKYFGVAAIVAYIFVKFTIWWFK